MSEDTKEPDDYKVGYRKPPKKSQFKKGKSGNSNGRPKGSKNRKPPDSILSKLVLEEARRSVALKEGDTIVTVPMVQAAIKSLQNQAVKGNVRAQERYLAMVDQAEKEEEARKTRLLEAALDYKMNVRKIFEKCREEGKDAPDDLPFHPDQIYIDPETDEVLVLDWESMNEKTPWQTEKHWKNFILFVKREKDKFPKNIEQFEKDEGVEPGTFGPDFYDEMMEAFDEDIAYGQHMIKICRAAYVEDWDRAQDLVKALRGSRKKSTGSARQPSRTDPRKS